jgi:hypothetical protein
MWDGESCYWFIVEYLDRKRQYGKYIRLVDGTILMKSIFRKCFHIAECRIPYCKLLVMERIYKTILSKQLSTYEMKISFSITLQATWGSAQQTSNL